MATENNRNRGTMQKKRRSRKGRLWMLLLGAAAICLLTGCAGKEKAATSVDDTVAGFLYHFDQRQETVALNRSIENGKLPVSVTWYYPDRPVLDETEIVPEPFTTEDPDIIRDVYTALGNVIVVGNASSRLANNGYYVSFVLPEGGECRFDFISENTIRLSEHNYSIESDGTLWGMLRETQKS